MAHKRRNPAVRQGFENCKSFQATCNLEDTLPTCNNQGAIAWLARRARISASMANAVATANNWGRAS